MQVGRVFFQFLPPLVAQAPPVAAAALLPHLHLPSEGLDAGLAAAHHRHHLTHITHVWP